jgi:hypothetical protein
MKANYDKYLEAYLHKKAENEKLITFKKEVLQ